MRSHLATDRMLQTGVKSASGLSNNPFKLESPWYPVWNYWNYGIALRMTDVWVSPQRTFSIAPGDQKGGRRIADFALIHSAEGKTRDTILATMEVKRPDKHVIPSELVSKALRRLPNKLRMP